jgi:crossover junction endodeoxyribonuclease RuvC
MRVLGIDPGTFKMGVGVVDSERGELKMVYAGVISPKRSTPLPERMHHLQTELLEIIHEWKPSIISIEAPFVSKNVRAAMAVGQAQAVAMLSAASEKLEIAGYSPREVKQSVTDYGGSTKEQVQEMVKILLGLNEPPVPLDATDALAVAICHINATHVKNLTVLE